MSRSELDPHYARRLKLLLTLAAQNPHRVAVEKRFWNIEFCTRFIDWCIDQAFDLPETAMEMATVALHAANQTHNRHAVARALALKSSAYRLESNIPLAKKLMQKARDQAGSCPCCLFEINRRGGILAEEAGHTHQALQLLDSAVTYAQRLQDSDAVGRILVSRGISHNKLGNFEQALADENKALQLLSTSSPKVFHLAAMINMGWILVGSNDATFARASSYLSSFENRLVGKRVPSIVRHKLKWLDGLILARLGDRKRALEKLRNVRSALIRSRHDADAIALTADIVQIYLQTSSFRSIANIVRHSIVTVGDIANTRPILERLASYANREIAESSQECVGRIRDLLQVNMPSFITSPTASPVAP